MLALGCDGDELGNVLRPKAASCTAVDGIVPSVAAGDRRVLDDNGAGDEPGPAVRILGDGTLLIEIAGEAVADGRAAWLGTGVGLGVKMKRDDGVVPS